MTGSAVVCAALIALGTAGDSPAPARPSQERKPPVDRLSDEVLQRVCGDPTQSIGLVKVDKVQLRAKGSRSEHVVAKLSVEQTICGALPAAVEAWCFTSNGQSLLAEGRRYVLALAAGAGYAPFGFGEFVEVPPGRERESTELHQRAVKALTAPQH